ncbi:MAG TPA: hypothetical protein VFN41_07080 [Candidatus Limnocylindrales bacterium]|nr:hypothetical protein [Candidatus Limnocylindrales bacterium]
MDTTTSADPPSDGWLRFRLSAVRSGVEADVRLRRAGDRWVSVSDSMGRDVTGIGSTARAAIVASLDQLGPVAVMELLADLRLLDVSMWLTEVPAV